jgi:hypothetical protein
MKVNHPLQTGLGRNGLGWRMGVREMAIQWTTRQILPKRNNAKRLKRKNLKET